jgi:ATP-binding cassette subfamily C protein CydC
MLAQLKQHLRTLKADRWVRPLLKRYRRLFWLALALGALSLIFAAALMYTSGYMISLAAALPLTVLAVHVPSIFVRIFGVGKPLLQYAQRLISHNFALSMTSSMRKRLYSALAARVSASNPGGLLGETLTLLNEDIGHVQNLILRCVLPLFTSFAVALVVTILCGIFSWRLAVAALCMMLLVCVFLPIMSAAASANYVHELQKLQAQAYTRLSNNIYGLTDWVLSAKKSAFEQAFVDSANQKNAVRSRILRVQHAANLASQVLLALSVIAMFLWAACVFAGLAGGTPQTPAQLLLAGAGNQNAPAYSPNWVAAFVLSVFPLMEAFSPLVPAAQEFNARAISLDHLAKFDAQSATRAQKIPVQTQNASIPKFREGDPCITFSNVTFTYPGAATPVFENFTEIINHGQKVVVRGPSGQGKTTLASLIHADIFPDEGLILIGGVPTPNLAAHIYAYVGYSHQFPYIFNTTLRENLLVAAPTATDAQLVQALETARLTSYFERLPHGLDTHIYEGGFNMSGGERQRLALSRILLQNPQVVILDEPFNSLDWQCAEALTQDILRIFANKTVILITHSAHTPQGFTRTIQL